MTVINSLKGTFKSLNDTPNTYIGEAGNQIVVNSTEDGLIFSSAGSAINFSFDDIEVSTTLLIPIRQQMWVYQSINIDGILDINGRLILKD